MSETGFHIFSFIMSSVFRMSTFVSSRKHSYKRSLFEFPFPVACFFISDGAKTENGIPSFHNLYLRRPVFSAI